MHKEEKPLNAYEKKSKHMPEFYFNFFLKKFQSYNLFEDCIKRRYTECIV